MPQKPYYTNEIIQAAVAVVITPSNSALNADHPTRKSAEALLTALFDWAKTAG